MSLVDLGKQLLDAAKNGRTDEVRTLMSNGAPFTTDWLGTSPLHFASHSGHLGTAEVLLRAGISRDARTKVDRTPLHVACQEGHMEIVDLLIKNGADVEARDMLKMTPLHWAVEKGHIHVIELLLGHGSDINCENKFDKSPVDIAFSNGRTDLAEILQLARLPQSSMVEVAPDQTVVEEVTTTEFDEGTEEEIADSHSHLITRPLVVSSAGMEMAIKTEKGDIEYAVEEESGEQNSTAVLATLAALAEATGPLTASNANTTTADALNWLETQGITMISSGENQTLVNASLAEAGQTLTLTDAGKLALNFVKQQSSDDGETDPVQGDVESAARKVITIVTSQGQLAATTADGTPVVLKLASDHESGEPATKRIKLEEVEISEETVGDDHIVDGITMECPEELGIVGGGEVVVGEQLLHDSQSELTEVLVSEVETNDC